MGARTFVQLPGIFQQTVVDLYPFFCTQRGVIQTLPDVHSPQLNNTRPIFVYLPPSFVENPLPRITNIVVLLDGQWLPWFNDTLGALMVSGEAMEMVVVGVPSLPDTRTFELTFSPCEASCSPCPSPDPGFCNCSSSILGPSGGSK